MQKIIFYHWKNYKNIETAQLWLKYKNIHGKNGRF